MRSQQQFRSIRQPYVSACAVVQVQEQTRHKIALMVAYTIASAIIVLWMAYLPILKNNILSNSNIKPTHLSASSDSVNHVNKGDQLTSIRFRAMERLRDDANTNARGERFQRPRH